MSIDEIISILNKRLDDCEKTIASLARENAKSNAKIEAVLYYVNSNGKIQQDEFQKKVEEILKSDGDSFIADAYGQTLEEYRRNLEEAKKQHR